MVGVHSKSLLATFNLTDRKLPSFLVYDGVVYESYDGQMDADLICDTTPIYEETKKTVRVLKKYHVKLITRRINSMKRRNFLALLGLTPVVKIEKIQSSTGVLHLPNNEPIGLFREEITGTIDIIFDD